MKFEKISIDSKMLDKYNLTLDEFLYLLLFARKNEECFAELLKNSLFKKGFLTENYSFFPAEDSLKIVKKGTEALKEILVQSHNSLTTEESNQIEELAKKLKDIFPKGAKSPGHPWGGNIREIYNKLKKFKQLYNYSDEAILEATQHYVNSMSSDTTYMRTLKYFILKQNENKEEISDLASYIESYEEGTTEGWTNKIKYG